MEKSLINKSCAGFSLVEVLVTLIILLIGLLGLSGIQSRLQTSEMEAYQRSQALTLLQDMTSRINTNRANAVNYVTGTGSPVGTGDSQPTDCSDGSIDTVQKFDTCEWSNSLKGATESSSGTNIGAMIGARGCIEAINTDGSAATEEYLITIAWQGLQPITAPTAGVQCGLDLYNGSAGSSCINDLCRRVVTSIVIFGDLN